MRVPRHLPALSLIIGTVLAGVACGDEAEPLDLPPEAFGIDASCAPVRPGVEYLLSPTVIEFEAEATLSALRMTVEGREPETVEQVLATAGVRGGDQLVLRPDEVEIESLADAVIDTPGEVVIALRVSGDEPVQVVYTGLEFESSGRLITIEDLYVLTIADEC
ncbi:MAG: hypothetical protein AAF480_15755 [Actinomycetota bacterium]